MMNRYQMKANNGQKKGWRRFLALLSALMLLISSTGVTAFAEASDEDIYSDPVTAPIPKPAAEETPAPETSEEPPEEETTEPVPEEETEEPTEEVTPEEETPEPTPEIVYNPGSLTGEADGVTVRLDYTAEACIPDDVIMTFRPVNGAEYYSAMKSVSKLVRQEENTDSVWTRVLKEDGNTFYIVTLADSEGNEIQPAAAMTLTVENLTAGEEYYITGANAHELSVENGSLIIPEYSLESFGHVSFILQQTGNITLEHNGPDYQVIATYGPDAGFPAGTELKVREILPGTAEYRLYSGMTDEALNEEWAEITLERYFDITFVADGKELEPEGFVDVQIIFRDKIEQNEETEVQAVHIENNEANVIEAETDSNKAAKHDAEAIDTVAFTSDSFSVYGVVQKKKITQKVLAADGNTYEINVTYTAEASIPEGSTLKVEEIPEGSDLWEAYRKQTAAALGADDVRLPGLYDITIIDPEGNPVEPVVPVNVSIKLANAETEEDLHVVHFTEDIPQELVEAVAEEKKEEQTEVQSLTAEELIAHETITEKTVEGDTVTFDTDGFSVYAFAYTVDFHYIVDGRRYDFSIPGGGFVSFAQMIELLHIPTTRGAVREVEEWPEEVHGEAEKVYFIPNTSISEETRNFVSQIENIEFSSPNLVSVSKVEAASTIGQIKEQLGLVCEYSTELTEKNIEDINAQTVEAGDWVLISVLPFNTEEWMTVTMKDGEVFTVKVTDAQIKTTFITAAGEKYEITVTYNDTAEIPDDAQLQVREIMSSEEKYTSNIETANRILAKEEGNEIQNPVQFEIAIVTPEGVEIEPREGSLVSVEIKLVPEIFEQAPADPEAEANTENGETESGNGPQIWFFGSGDDIETIPFANFTVTHIISSEEVAVVENVNSSISEDNKIVIQFETESFSDYIVQDSNRKELSNLPDTLYVGDAIYMFNSGDVWCTHLNNVLTETQLNQAQTGNKYKTYEIKKPGTFYFCSPNDFYTWLNNQSRGYPDNWYKKITVLPETSRPGYNQKPDQISTVENASVGIKLNLFDYDKDHVLDDRFNNYDFYNSNNTDVPTEYFLNYGINQGHTLKFMGSGDVGDRPGGKNRYTQTVINPDIVEKRLVNGYPKLNGGESLAYLFAPGGDGFNKIDHLNVDGLFKKVDDYYVFDSYENYAYLNGDTFEVYNGTYNLKDWSHSGGETGQEQNRVIGFFPFHPYDAKYDQFTSWNKYLNHHFGLSMSVQFNLPENPKAVKDSKGNPIVFEFRGDDDMWVFIDDILAMDIGGIHNSLNGRIDFTNQVVTLYDNKQVQMDQDTFRRFFANPNSNEGVNLYDGKMHTLKVFYMERGGADSNCKMMFNLTRYGDLNFTKKGEGDNALKGAKFGLFRDENCTETLKEQLNNGSSRDYTATSDDSGHVEFKGLPVGHFYLKETSAPEGYELDETVHDVEVFIGTDTGSALEKVKATIDGTPAQDFGVVIENIKRDKWTVKIRKSVKVGNDNAPVEGVKFRIYKEDDFYNHLDPIDPATVENLHTRFEGDKFVADELGRFYWAAIEEGVYVLVETDAPYGVVLEENPVTLTIRIDTSKQKLYYKVGNQEEGSSNLIKDGKINAEIDIQVYNTLQEKGKIRIQKLWNGEENGTTDAKAVLLSLDQLHGGQVVPGAFDNLYTNRATYGLSDSDFVDVAGTKYLAIKKNNNIWEKVIQNLPMVTATKATGVVPYYYTATEIGYINNNDQFISSEGDGFTWQISYSGTTTEEGYEVIRANVNDRDIETLIINNEKQYNLKVKKEWQDSDGNVVEGTDNIRFQLIRHENGTQTSTTTTTTTSSAEEATVTIKHRYGTSENVVKTKYDDQSEIHVGDKIQIKWPQYFDTPATIQGIEDFYSEPYLFTSGSKTIQGWILTFKVTAKNASITANWTKPEHAIEVTAIEKATTTTTTTTTTSTTDVSNETVLQPASSGNGYEPDTTGEYTFTLAPNETKQFINLPWADGDIAYTYEVREDAIDGYTTTYRPGDAIYNPAPDVEGDAGKNGEITIVNRPVEVPKGKLTIGKHITEHGIDKAYTGTFNFGVYTVNNPTKDTEKIAEDSITLTNASTGTVTIDNLLYNTYFIFELDEDGAPITTGEAMFNGVTYTVSNDHPDGVPVHSETGKEGIADVTITNDNVEPGELIIKKSILGIETGSIEADGQYTFQILGVKDTVTADYTETVVITIEKGEMKSATIGGADAGESFSKENGVTLSNLIPGQYTVEETGWPEMSDGKMMILDSVYNGSTKITLVEGKDPIEILAGGTAEAVFNNRVIETIDIQATKKFAEGTTVDQMPTAIRLELFTYTDNDPSKGRISVESVEGRPNPVIITRNNDTWTTASWNDLQKYVDPNYNTSGLIQYTVEETGVYFGELTDGSVPADKWIINTSDPAYEGIQISDIYEVSYLSGTDTKNGNVVIDGDTHSGSITITNEPETVDVIVQKEWAPVLDNGLDWTVTFDVMKKAEPENISVGTITINNRSTEAERTMTGLKKYDISEGIPVLIEYTAVETEYTVKRRGETTPLYSYHDGVYTYPDSDKAYLIGEPNTTALADGNQQILITNSQETSDLIVYKEWVDVINYDEMPAVKFGLYRYKKGTDPDHSENIELVLQDLELSKNNNWKWTLPAGTVLPEAADDGRTYIYFVDEVRETPNSVYVQYDPTGINPEMIPYHKIVYKGIRSSYDGKSTQTENATNPKPYQAYIEGTSGSFTISNLAPGGYIQMDIKKKYLEYRIGSSNNVELWTTTQEVYNMTGKAIEVQIYRRAVEDKEIQQVGDFQPSEKLKVEENWKEYGNPIIVGYDENGTETIFDDGDNVFTIENDGGTWAWTIARSSHQGGLPTHGYLSDGTVVKYQYVIVETKAYIVQNGQLILDSNMMAVLPAVWQGKGDENDAQAQQFKEFPAVVAQDQDRLINIPSARLTITKEWTGSAEAKYIYLKLFRKDEQAGNPINSGVDATNILNKRVYNFNGFKVASDLTINEADIKVINGQTYIRLSLDNEWTTTIEHVPLLSKNGAFYYWIQEVGYGLGEDDFIESLDQFKPILYSSVDGTQIYGDTANGGPAIIPTRNGVNHLKVQNTSSFGSLKIIKAVTPGAGEDAATQTFTFDVVLTPPSGKTIDVSNLTVSSETGNTVTLDKNSATKDGEIVTIPASITGVGSLTISGIPTGTRYTVEENNLPAGWYLVNRVYSDDAEKLITADVVDTVTFTNTEKTEVTVTKSWVEETSITWPEGIASVQVGLKRIVTGGTAENVMKDESRWVENITSTSNAVFTQLPVYDEHGNKYTYSIEEISVTLTNGTVVTKAENRIVITGTYANTWQVVETDVNEDGTATITNTKVTTNFDILKVNGKDETKLQPLTGAEFKLEKKETNGEFAVLADYETIAVDGDGHASITGLTDGEYRLYETKSPAGYVAYTGEIAFTITNGVISFKNNLQYVTYAKEDGKDGVFTVRNYPGAELPATGGSGTLIYTITGLALVTLAGVIFLARRKRNHI